MKIAVMKETHEGETRVPLIPPTVEKLVKLGAELEIESGLGLACRYEDSAYTEIGAKTRDLPSRYAEKRGYRPAVAQAAD